MLLWATRIVAILIENSVFLFAFDFRMYRMYPFDFRLTTEKITK